MEHGKWDREISAFMQGTQ